MKIRIYVLKHNKLLILILPGNSLHRLKNLAASCVDFPIPDKDFLFLHAFPAALRRSKEL
jgi:hypothetical protein